MKSRNLGALVALGALTALPACSMFGGNSGSGQYQQSSYATPATPPASYNTAANTTTNANQTVAPVSREMIRHVQRTLKQNGDYNSAVDGVWGPMTENGVRKWQQAHNLATNGEIDVATLQSMNIPTGSGNNAAYNQGNGTDNGQPNGTTATNQSDSDNSQNAQANGGANYNTAGTHPSGNSYSNNGQATPYPTNQGNAANNPTTATGTPNTTH